MPVFQYKAVNNQGEVKTGSMSAVSQQDVITKIQQLGLIPISAEAATISGGGKKKAAWRFRKNRLGTADIAAFTRQVAILVGAGLPLDRALGIIRQVSSLPPMVELVEELQNAVRSGDSLSKALMAQPIYFSNFYINFIRSAEISGNLAGSLEDLSRYIEKAQALKNQLLSAMLYPAILVGVTLLSLGIIMVYVLPEFSKLFEDMDASLPASTAFVLGVADGVRSYGLLFIGMLVLLVLYVRHRQQDEAWRMRWDARVLSMALLGDLTKKVEMARLSRSLGTLLKGGVPLLAAIKIARDSLKNRVMASSLDEVVASLQEGSGLAEPLMEAGVFPEFALQMVQVGEETGRLDQMLIKVADIYDDEVSTATQRMLSILEPLIIIGLGLLIGGIIMSILVAILSINELPL
ncbi:MAG TPA: type II secretion system F family protein [Porticoccus sp.]|nr:type II secretion system F family protein [Porticoccus sp.]